MMHEDIISYFSPLDEREAELKKNYENGKLESSEKVRTIPSVRYIGAGQTIAFVKHRRFTPTFEHTHDYIELMYVLSGSLIQHIGGDTVRMKAGDIIIFRQYTHHSIDIALENDIAVDFILLPEFFDKTLEMLGEEPSPLHSFFTLCLKANTGTHEYLHFNTGEHPQIRGLMDILLWNLISGTSGRNSINENLMGLIMLYLQDAADGRAVMTDDSVIWQVLHYIEKNYRTCSLKDCAENLHFGYYTLANRIKKETGKTFVRLVQEKRLSRATYLLRGTSLTIREIAHSVGYENEGFFYKLFTEQYGVSPYEYRKKYK